MRWTVDSPSSFSSSSPAMSSQAMFPSSPALFANGRSSRQHRVLLLDDEPDVLSAMEATLRVAELAVTAIGVPEQARNILASERFDLVVTDLYLGDGPLGTAIAE